MSQILGETLNHGEHRPAYVRLVDLASCPKPFPVVMALQRPQKRQRLIGKPWWGGSHNSAVSPRHHHAVVVAQRSRDWVLPAPHLDRGLDAPPLRSIRRPLHLGGPARALGAGRRRSSVLTSSSRLFPIDERFPWPPAPGRGRAKSVVSARSPWSTRDGRSRSCSTARRTWG